MVHVEFWAYGMILKGSFFILVCIVAAPDLAWAAGFQFRPAPDPDDRTLQVGIWYPSDAATMHVEGLPEPVALDGGVVGNDLPLIVISHGNGGVFSSHNDTALALANEGFVVASVTHTGDNFMDESYAGTTRWFSDRPRHIQRVIDYMLSEWPERARLDETRIGFFGFSMVGYTGMIVVGATPELERVRTYCAEHPVEFACSLLMQLNSEVIADESLSVTTWAHDTRVKAAVLAAPGFPYAFDPQDVAALNTPVQLWLAEHDDPVPEDTLVGMLSAGFERHSVEGAGHFAFLPPCNFSPILCSDPDGFDRAAFHEALNAEIVLFFTRTLSANQDLP